MNSSFLRMSWTLKALRIVCSISRDLLGGAAGALDLLLRAGAEGVGPDGELGLDLAGAEDLDRVAALGQAGLAEGLGGHLVARLEALIEVADVDRLGPRAELLEGHRHLVVRAAQLPHPHVDRGLAALVGDLALRAGAGAGSLVAPARGLAETAALAAAQALARGARALGRAQVVETHRLVGLRFVLLLVGAHFDSPPTSTRCSTARIWPWRFGESGKLDSLPIRPSFSERSAARWSGEAPLAERTCFGASRQPSDGSFAASRASSAFGSLLACGRLGLRRRRGGC